MLIFKIGCTSLSEVFSEQLKIHSNIIEMSDDSYVSLKRGKIQHPEASSNVTRLKNVTVENAIPAMFAYHYGNQALQLLVHVCMVCMSFGFDGSIPLDEGMWYIYLFSVFFFLFSEFYLFLCTILCQVL